MYQLLSGRIALCLGAMVLLLAGCTDGRQTAAPQKTLLHVFAYTALDSATPKDFEDFKNATENMVGKIPGLRKAWVAKLREPFPAENDRIRTHGVGMEFDNAEALGVYANHPLHAEWVKIYERVRQPGTTTMDIQTQ